MFKIFVSGHVKNRAMWIFFILSLDNNWLKILNCFLGPTPLPLNPPQWSIFSLVPLTIAFTMLCVSLKGTCSGQSKVSPYNKLQHANRKRDITKTSTSPMFQHIAHCRNVRGLWLCSVCLQKLRHSNERSTKFESLYRG